MYDNKVRLSSDVIEKAQLIAAEWGLKNARAAVEAVFRRYADEYLYGRHPLPPEASAYPPSPAGLMAIAPPEMARSQSAPPKCEALDALEDLLAM
ncbi:MAG: hypothetical protein VKK04_21915 [Synechococcales bacterium]|nr:hypothetical protein [Synechococcales bacterium]